MDAPASALTDLLTTEAVLLLSHLRRVRTDACALQLARSTNLSTLVVIPVLQHLVELGLVSRRAVEVDGSSATWAYRLTARGLREVRSPA